MPKPTRWLSTLCLLFSTSIVVRYYPCLLFFQYHRNSSIIAFLQPAYAPKSSLEEGRILLMGFLFAIHHFRESARSTAATGITCCCVPFEERPNSRSRSVCFWMKEKTRSKQKRLKQTRIMDSSADARAFSTSRWRFVDVLQIGHSSQKWKPWKGFVHVHWHRD